MNKQFFICAALFLCLAVPAGAHPPLDIALEYDHENQTLHVEMEHIVRNMKDHYIRKTLITKNNGTPIEEYSRRQTTPTSYVMDVPLPAKTGDQITVEAFCSEGGSLSATLIVPAPGQDDKKAASAPETGTGRQNTRSTMSGY